MPAGCPKPSCLGKNKFKIIDAWKRKSNNALYQWDYGFSALIELPGDAYDINGGSILLRFAQGNRQGSIQTWNFRYFGFYNNNNDVLFHTKVNTHTIEYGSTKPYLICNYCPSVLDSSRFNHFLSTGMMVIDRDHRVH